MTKIDVVEHIFSELRSMGFVRHRHEFVRNWLGREESYIRVLRKKMRSPSVSVFRTCANKLIGYGEAFEKNPLTKVDDIGRQFRGLAYKCQLFIDQEISDQSASRP